MALPHGAVGWSAVCDCGISRSYSLIFCQPKKSDHFLGLTNPDINRKILGAFTSLSFTVPLTDIGFALKQLFCKRLDSKTSQ